MLGDPLRDAKNVASVFVVIAHQRFTRALPALLPVAQSARDLETALARRQRLAEERIAQAESKAIEEIRAVAVDAAIDAARRVIVSEIDEARGGALLDAAITALPQRLR